MTRMLLSAGLAALCLAPAARAEALYRCEDGKGAVSIQSEPCPKGMTQVWKRGREVPWRDAMKGGEDAQDQ